MKQITCWTVLCEDDTCSSNGKCEPVLDGDKYVPSCYCDDGYHGDTCDKGENVTFEKYLLTWCVITL